MLSPALRAIRRKAVSLSSRVIFPEQEDVRVQEALKGMVKLSICRPVILRAGPGDEACDVFYDRGDVKDWIERAESAYALSRANKSVGISAAREALDDPLLLASLLVKLGFADSGVAGSIAPTAKVLRACLRGVGLSSDTKLVSSIFLIDHPHRLMSFADCAIIPQPDAAQLAQIAIDSASTHEALTGHSAKVAFLSFSTFGSAQHADVEKVRDAQRIAKLRMPSLESCGEMQVDAALIPEVAQKKASASDVAGDANVLIFPDLNSGNIAYKIAERLGGANATGPILQGLAKPWMDLSRGCECDDIVNAAAIAALMSSE